MLDYDFFFDKLNCYVDLHLHLDGSISVNNLKSIALIQDINLEKSDEELTQILQVSSDCTDLNEYLKCFDFPLKFLQTEEGLYYATKNLLKELERDGVMYAEIRFAPQLHTREELNQRQAVDAVVKASKEGAINNGIILCCMRGNNNHKENKETISLIEEYIGNCVCGGDLAGAEAVYPTKDFIDLFAPLKNENIPFTIHAGEADGPKSINFALDAGAKRIGHGVRAVQSDQTMSRLKNIPIEVCIQSEINTGIFKKYSDFDMRKFLKSGIPVTINTDNLTVSSITIKEEYKRISKANDLSKQEIKLLLTNGVNSAFTSDTLKKDLLNKIELNFGI